MFYFSSGLRSRWWDGERTRGECSLSLWSSLDGGNREMSSLSPCLNGGNRGMFSLSPGLDGCNWRMFSWSWWRVEENALSLSCCHSMEELLRPTKLTDEHPPSEVMTHFNMRNLDTTQPCLGKENHGDNWYENPWLDSVWRHQSFVCPVWSNNNNNNALLTSERNWQF